MVAVAMEEARRVRVAAISAELDRLHAEMNAYIREAQAALTEGDVLRATAATRQVAQLNAQISALTREWTRLAARDANPPP